jgi:hypothetical protein
MLTGFNPVFMRLRAPKAHPRQVGKPAADWQIGLVQPTGSTHLFDRTAGFANPAQVCQPAPLAWDCCAARLYADQSTATGNRANN